MGGVVGVAEGCGVKVEVGAGDVVGKETGIGLAGNTVTSAPDISGVGVVKLQATNPA